MARYVVDHISTTPRGRLHIWMECYTAIAAFLTAREKPKQGSH